MRSQGLPPTGVGVLKKTCEPVFTMPRSLPEILTSILTSDDAPLPLATPVPETASAPVARTSNATVFFATAAAEMRRARTAPCTCAPDVGTAVGASVEMAAAELGVLVGGEPSMPAKGS